jgi:hypothetical protein
MSLETCYRTDWKIGDVCRVGNEEGVVTDLLPGVFMARVALPGRNLKIATGLLVPVRAAETDPAGDKPASDKARRGPRREA